MAQTDNNEPGRIVRSEDGIPMIIRKGNYVTLVAVDMLRDNLVAHSKDTLLTQAKVVGFTDMDIVVQMLEKDGPVYTFDIDSLEQTGMSKYFRLYPTEAAAVNYIIKWELHDKVKRAFSTIQPHDEIKLLTYKNIIKLLNKDFPGIVDEVVF